ncbi:MAG: LytR/AlgR family response regulator transcription factor [Saprospiraceae bacterium]
MEKLRCLLIDHDRNARDLLRHHIEKIPNLYLVNTFAHPMEAIFYLQSHPVDIIFMDFALPELNGSELLQLLNPKPLVIFTTAHSEYALQGFQLDAVDFLLKPIDFQGLLRAVNKAIRIFHSLKTPYYTETKKSEQHYLVLKSNRRFHRIATENIIYIQGMKEYAAIYLKDHSRLLFLHSLRNLETLLPVGYFTRIHKSYIVANDKITALEGSTLYLGDVKIPVGESYKDRVLEQLFS